MAVWKLWHLAAIVGAIWFTTIFLGIIMGSLIYGVGPISGGASTGVLKTEGLQINMVRSRSRMGRCLAAVAIPASCSTRHLPRPSAQRVALEAGPTAAR